MTPFYLLTIATLILYSLSLHYSLKKAEELNQILLHAIIHKNYDIEFEELNDVHANRNRTDD